MDEIRAAHKKVIAFGSFDPLHKGHINFLHQAQKLGDFLVVIVARDENIIANKKHQPLISEDKRLEAVLATKIADKVELGDAFGVYSILKKEKPDIIALGYDQKIPPALKNEIKECKIVTLRPYKSNIYKSSKIKQKRGLGNLDGLII